MIRAVEARASKARLKELQPFLPEKAGESLNHTMHETHLSFTVHGFHPRGQQEVIPRAPGGHAHTSLRASC